MRGDKVIVRAFGDELLVRRVWTTTDKAIGICSEENYQLLIKDEKGGSYTGFLKEYVFKFDPNYRNKSWEELEQYE